MALKIWMYQMVSDELVFFFKYIFCMIYICSLLQNLVVYRGAYLFRYLVFMLSVITVIRCISLVALCSNK